MKRMPNSRSVDLALNNLTKRLKECLDGIHHQASHVMSKGEYDKAEALIAAGKQLQAFQLQVNALKDHWRGLKGSNMPGKESSRTTPLWAYYQSILQALVESGGEAARVELEPRVESLMKKSFLPGDSDKMSHNRYRWQLMIRRARKHLIHEGWLEPSNSRKWQITPEGEIAAKANNK